MAGGYGMRDGSAIVNAIGQYAQYNERQNDKAYARERQEKLDYENSQRQKKADTRADALFNRQMGEYDYKDKERERVGAERERSLSSREDYVGLTKSNIDEQEAAELSRFDKVRQTLGTGSSGQGKGLVANDTGDGFTTLSVTREDGEVPLTVKATDNKSTPIRARNEDIPALEEHAARSAEFAEKSGVDPQYHSAYIRAGFTADEGGVVRPATHEEFTSNLREQGLLDAIKGKQTAPNEDVPIEAGKGEQHSKATMRESGKTDFDIANPIGSVQKEMVKSVYTGLEQMYSVAKKGAGKVLEAGEWLSEGAMERGFDKSIKKTAKSFLLGKDAQTTVQDDGVAKVRPTAKVATPEGVADLRDTKETIEKVGGAPPKLRPELKQISEVEDVEAKLSAVREKYANMRKQASVIGELYITGNINEKDMTNFMETGDMRFNMHDIEKHNVSMIERKAAADSKVLKARDDLIKRQVEAAKATSTLKDDKQKQLKATRGHLKDVGGSVAAFIGAKKGMQADQIKGLAAQVEILADRFVASERYGLEAMGTVGFAGMWSGAVESYLQDNPSSDLSVMSITPYMTATEAKYKPAAAETIKSLSANFPKADLQDIRKQYNDHLIETHDAITQGGKVAWTDGMQADVDELFKAKFMSEQR
ncbi:hypothetical protein HC000_01990 [Pseudoalteromonas sp. MIP2626]|uniref:hypothetical protein n=1 Tax=Pseudoalteromonas sp. MIP2626 TaxID=2705464 RepID=UPI0015C8EF92|nr:hypothetical protein [Pseudoalteromonas sp. MIP2626]NYR11270.1 hypothetical protein [Pseudoalteromonas sp. MIP2626]